MLTIALRTARARWVTFVGSFVALALGVGLITTMGLGLAATLDAPQRLPERFPQAPVVVKGDDVLRVPVPGGERTGKLAHPGPVTPELARRLASLGPTTEDRSFPVRAEGGPKDLVGHPWSVAAFAPYTLDTGRVPRSDDEVVTTGWARTGARIGTDHGPVTVVGTVADRGFEDAVFWTDARAARLSPAIDQLVVVADPTAVRDAVRDAMRDTAPDAVRALPGQESEVRVLTGRDRRHADPDPEREREALLAVNALLGTAGGVTGFVSVFVVASTFAFAVARRRKEFALLRTAGATPGQIRRTVVAEALLLGVAASATGCLLGAYGAPVFVSYLVDEDLAPRWFTLGDATWPYHAAFWAGLLVALAGVVAASWRAGRVAPTEALREAAFETRSMTPGRLLLGAALLLAGLVTLAHALLTDPSDLLHRKTYISRPMLFIVAFALLSPLLVRPLVRLIAWLPARLPGASGMLIRENAAAGVRRTGAVAAPVLVTVALAGSLLGTTATLNEAKAAEIRQRTTADHVITAGPGGFDPATIERIRAVPGTEISATAATAVHVQEEGTALIRSDARAVDPAALARTARLPLTAGSVTDLDDDSVIVTEEWERHTVGSTVEVWLGDGTRKALRIAAVMSIGTGGNGAYVTPANAPGATVDRIDVRLAPGADGRAVGAALAEAARPAGGRVLTADRWMAENRPGTRRTTRTGLLLVLGIALLYTGIALAGTLVMATSDRARDLAVLRLAGATRGQVLRLVAGESLLVVLVGASAGTLVAALNLAGVRAALGLLHVRSGLVVPWDALAATFGACAAVAVAAAVVPAALCLRRGAVERAGERD
ncbi:putative ABC transport system permease protein [Streptomyces sp. CG 926]|uniref:ABC transporter permease n=1 Tax=Streptomyces sp. CG 926 TaxID=1882405 RepID=UPI000D6C706D|nr:ABC transporter permease [Streptomyces sp. CG 926]PWK66787.1 putative ABC transport system permease protein [Streptomyces sp. CG 926]